jgi:hypothetical protein
MRENLQDKHEFLSHQVNPCFNGNAIDMLILFGQGSLEMGTHEAYVYIPAENLKERRGCTIIDHP